MAYELTVVGGLAPRTPEDAIFTLNCNLSVKLCGRENEEQDNRVEKAQPSTYRVKHIRERRLQTADHTHVRNVECLLHSCRERERSSSFDRVGIQTCFQNIVLLRCAEFTEPQQKLITILPRNNSVLTADFEIIDTVQTYSTLNIVGTRWVVPRRKRDSALEQDSRKKTVGRDIERDYLGEEKLSQIK